jgi:hypothetical protein
VPATELLFVLAASDAYNAGRWFGRLLIPILVIALIVWSVQRYRRR